MRSELDVLRGLYRYHFRELRKYCQRIWSLPVSERYRDRGSTYPSLVDMYLHILDDYRFWFIKAYTGHSFQDFPLGIHLTRAEAERATRQVELLVINFLQKLRPEDLDRRFYIKWDRKSITVRSMLLQMVEGDLQHKGELNALLWQMDIKPPPVELANSRLF